MYHGRPRNPYLSKQDETNNERMIGLKNKQTFKDALSFAWHLRFEKNENKNVSNGYVKFVSEAK